MNSKSTEVSTIDSSMNVSIISQYDYDKVVSELTDDQRKHCHELTKDINIASPNTIQSYGQEINKIIAKQADDLLDKASANRTTDVVVLTNQLLSEIGDVDMPTKDHNPASSSWWRNLPIVGGLLGGLVKEASDAKIKRNTIGQNVAEISRKIESLKLVAMSDNASLETMAENTKTYILELRDRIVALKELECELRKDVESLEAEENPNLDILTAKRNALSAMSKRVVDMMTTETILKQNMNQIAGMMGNNDAIIQKADMTVSQVIPIWKQQLAIGTMIDNQQASAEIESRMMDTANRMLVNNAKRMNANSVEIAKQSEESFWKIETMRDTKNIMIDTIKQIQDIRDRGDADRDQLVLELKTIGEEYAQALLEAK